jgi:hypothetical protein
MRRITRDRICTACADTHAPHAYQRMQYSPHKVLRNIAGAPRPSFSSHGDDTQALEELNAQLLMAKEEELRLIGAAIVTICFCQPYCWYLKIGEYRSIPRYLFQTEKYLDCVLSVSSMIEETNGVLVYKYVCTSKASGKTC